MGDIFPPNVLDGVSSDTVLTLIGISIALGVFIAERFFERKHHKEESKERINRCIKTIEIEIEDHEKGFKDKNKFEEVNDNPPYTYRNMLFTYDGFDSLLNSGLFTYFHETTQNRLSNLYSRIKAHNMVLEKRDNARLQFFINGDYSEQRIALWKYHIIPQDVILHKYQKDIQEMLDDVKDLLNEEKSKNLG